MSELAGKAMVVKIDTTSSGAGTVIGGVDNTTLRQLCNLLDISAFGDSYHSRIAGLKDSSVSLSGNYDPADAGQLKINAGDTVWVQVLPNGTAGKKIEMLVEEFSQQASADGKQTFNATLQGNGAPTTV
jgi:predicted secreted protein